MKYKILVTDPISDTGISILKDNNCEVIDCTKDKSKISDIIHEIDGWIIDELKSIGCDTAKSVLELSATELVKRTDLEEETIREIQTVLKSEFED